MSATNYLTGAEAIDAFRNGRVTLEQIIDDHAKRFSDDQETLNAWAVAGHDAAKDAVKEAVTDGPLSGMMIGVKDIIATKDFPTEYGTKIYEGNRVGADAAVVETLRQAGATILGKTATHELAYGASPGTLNPYNHAKDAGGSSVGSAVAVCDYQCHVAIGSQTSGSLIRPAANSGVFAFKPTYADSLFLPVRDVDLGVADQHSFGLISMEGIKPLAPCVFDTLGILARSIQDIQLVSCVGKAPSSPSPPPPSSLRIGFVKTELFDRKATPELRRVWDLAKQCLTDAGVAVNDVDLGPQFDNLGGVEGRLTLLVESEIVTSLSRDYHKGYDLLSAKSRKGIEQGMAVDKAQMTALADELSALGPVMDQIASQYDALITPSTPGEVDDISVVADYNYLIMWTGLHVPMINMPGMFSKDGLPIGLSLLGARNGDEKLLQVARAIAPVLISAGGPNAKRIPAPDGAIHLQG